MVDMCGWGRWSGAGMGTGSFPSMGLGGVWVLVQGAGGTVSNNSDGRVDCGGAAALAMGGVCVWCVARGGAARAEGMGPGSA